MNPLVAGAGEGCPSSSAPEAPRPDDPRVIGAIEEYLTALENGHLPDRQEFLGRHAAIADVLAECLEGLELVHAATPRLQPPAAEVPDAAAGWSTEEPPVVPLADFRILREVGRGGMGVVYEAEQLSLGRRVALKVLPFAAALDPKRRRRFQREAQAAAQLHHQNIVPVYWVGCERGVHYYVMQFIDGQTLAALIRELRLAAALPEQPEEANSTSEGSEPVRVADRPATLAPSTLDRAWLTTGSRSAVLDRCSAPFFRMAADLGAQAAAALAHAHRLGVVHRDIKPANLLIDLRGNLWVTDFGLAQIRGGAGLTRSGDLIGTLRYMSPQQALAQRGPVDPRCDVYALGATLYELLTLEPAVAGHDRQEVLQQIAFAEPRAPRRHNPALPEELETIVLKAMEKNPADRYATAQELADDLRRFLADQPIRARRPTWFEQAKKWARRHRAVVVTALAAAVLLLLGGVAALALSTALIAREEERAEEALRAKEAALVQARANYAAAEANVQLARRAVDAMYTRLADPLHLRPRSQPLQREGVLNALEYYQQLARQEWTEPAMRRERALAMTKVGDIQYRLGRNPQAQEAYTELIALLEGLAAEFPSRASYRAELAYAYNALGLVLTRARRDREAEEAHGRGALLIRQLVAEFPDVPNYRLNLAGVHNNLGFVLHVRTRPREAEAAHREAIQLCERLVTEFPDRASFRGELARGYYGLGWLLAVTRRHPEAEDAYRQALSHLDEAAETLYTTHYGNLQPAVHHRLAEVLAALGRPQEAENNCRQAVAQGERLVGDFPHVPSHGILLSQAYTTLTRLLRQAGRRDAEEQEHRRAVAFYEQLAAVCRDEPVYQQGSAQAYLGLAKLFLAAGRPADALPSLRRSLALDADRSSAWYWLAQAQLAQGDTAGYRQTCAQLLDRFRQSGNPDVANSIAWVCVLVPGAAADPGQVVMLAEQAVTVGSLRHPANKADYLNTLGAALYRAGRFGEAIDHLNQAVAARGAEGNACDSFFLALAHGRRGEQSQARHWYDRACAWMTAQSPRLEKNRHYQEEFRRFRQEAAALLEP